MPFIFDERQVKGMSKHNRIFRWKAGFLFAAVALLGSAVFGRAQAVGSISGRVTDSVGVGIGNIRVEVYVYGLADNSDGYQSYSSTDAQGYYTISGLSDGSYVLHFTDYDLVRYFDEWYNDKSTYATANPVAVTGGGTTPGINVQMTKAGRISGRLTDKDGNGLSGVVVNVYDLSFKLIQGWSSDSEGNYVVTYLPAGQYKVNFSGLSANGLYIVPEWYNDKADFASADPVSVAFENTTVNINAQLQFQEGGKMSGRIVDSNGKGIMNIEIRAYDVNTQISQGYAVSGADGGYTITSILPGSYKVQFEDGLYDQFYYYSEWYNDKTSFQAADAITVVSGKTTEILDAVLIKKKIIDVSQGSIYLAAVQGGPTSPSSTVVISNSGIGTLNWTVTANSDVFSVTPSSGTGNGIITIGIARTDLAPGPSYGGEIIVTDPDACNSPRYIQVFVNIIAAGSDKPPFGSFDSPIDGITVASSIPVTGWALDDVGVQSVKIYYGTNESDRVYIGDAVFIEGARPDIDNLFIQVHPDIEKLWWYYPQDEKAGWGYMLLTDFLPNGGNGTFNLLAYATDLSGHEVLLGSKTIICDNANAVKPFGAIDTPTQGGTASGASYANFGWVLTPMPNSIPIDGSTITVWVDGLPLGHPVYSNYRADIATLFPGYANSNGAVGYYYLNTTGYADGVHTIEWSATDTGGNTDGIGSRYFTIQNAAPAPGQNSAPAPSTLKAGSGTGGRTAEEIAALPEDIRTPVFIKRGLAVNAPTETVLPDNDGITRIAIPEVTRVAVYLNENETGESEAEMIERGKRIRNGVAASGGSHPKLRDLATFRDRSGSRLESRFSSRYEAYQLVGGEIRPLPIGASFDSNSGAFYWQPGPGYLGEYSIILVKDENGASTKRTIIISILPR